MIGLILVLLAGDLGAFYDAGGKTIHFRVAAPNATRVEVYIYAAPFGQDERLSRVMTRDAQGIWSAEVAVSELGFEGPVYYGYRAWGPNWPYDRSWRKGSSAGFIADVDRDGHRFNPNKLLLDPYARETSHDPLNSRNTRPEVFASGPQGRTIDSGPYAPKGIVLRPIPIDCGPKPRRAFKDEIIYEVHVRGFTMNAPDVPEKFRGTYRGAAMKSAYLRELGVTAVEFLPVHEFQNEANDLEPSTSGDNYWGYMTLNYFSPDRRYAFDKSPGGPTREFREMVKAFHEQGIKVYLDVVYNHTGEGGVADRTGNVASIISWRVLDNATYYQLASDARFYYDNTGCGANTNCADPLVRRMILDSLRYWAEEMGVDGFRFDLAVVLGNAVRRGGFNFRPGDPESVLQRAARELRGVDLIVEPWGIGEGTFQLGNFPAPFAEWNAFYRDTIRRKQNRLGVEAVTPGQMAMRLSGSSDLFGDDGRRPWHSVNYIVSHDGFTLRDLYSYNAKNNGRGWPFGPSDGGEDNNLSWDQGGDAALQRQAARTALALLMTSAGVPMITGGDEFLRTQHGNNNPYNLDSEKNWMDWSLLKANAKHVQFTRRLLAFRSAHPALRPDQFYRGTDGNGNGLKDITWLKDDGSEPDTGYWNNADMHFLAYRLDGTELGDAAASIYVAYNGWSGRVRATVPGNLPGKKWYRVLDTAARFEGEENIRVPGDEPEVRTAYEVAPRSAVVLIEK